MSHRRQFSVPPVLSVQSPVEKFKMPATAEAESNRPSAFEACVQNVPVVAPELWSIRTELGPCSVITLEPVLTAPSATGGIVRLND